MYVRNRNNRGQQKKHIRNTNRPTFSSPFLSTTEMEGQSNKEKNTTESVCFDNGGTNNNDVSYSAEIPNPKSAIPAYGRSEDQWSNCLPTYVEYLSESSTYLPNTSTLTTTEYLPFGSITDGNSCRNLFYNDAGKSLAFKPIDSSSKRVGFWKPDEEGEEAIKVETESSQNRLYAEGHAEWKTDLSVGDKHKASKLNTMVKAGASTLLHKPGSSSSKHKGEKARATDRQRRQRITDNLKALHELLPNPHQEDSQAYILDDIIDYIKYLQLQVKELSGSRLQADSNAIPLVFHEGYGHYINQQMLNEPLEEIMGKLLEEHSGVADQLLESKGLFLMPIALANELNAAMQIFSGTA